MKNLFLELILGSSSLKLSILSSICLNEIGNQFLNFLKEKNNFCWSLNK